MSNLKSGMVQRMSTLIECLQSPSLFAGFSRRTSFSAMAILFLGWRKSFQYFRSAQSFSHGSDGRRTPSGTQVGGTCRNGNQCVWLDLKPTTQVRCSMVTQWCRARAVFDVTLFVPKCLTMAKYAGSWLWRIDDCRRVVSLLGVNVMSNISFDAARGSELDEELPEGRRSRCRCSRRRVAADCPRRVTTAHLSKMAPRQAGGGNKMATSLAVSPQCRYNVNRCRSNRKRLQIKGFPALAQCRSHVTRMPSN